MFRPTLYATHYSPWSHRAVWALDHHGIDYRYREHVPMLGELALRLRAKQPRRQPASVPLLITADAPLGDSMAIMHWADECGEGTPLRAGSEEAARWRDRVEPWLHAVRVRVTSRLARDRDAQWEAAAGGVPRALAGVCRPVAAMGARHIARKYGFDVDQEQQGRALMQQGLDAIRSALDDRPTIGERFGAVDILAATLMQGGEPADAFVPLGPATRRLWADEALADANRDLLQWRDELCAEHRPLRREPRDGAAA